MWQIGFITSKHRFGFLSLLFLFFSISSIAQLGYLDITDAKGSTTANSEVAQILLTSPDKAVIIQYSRGDQYIAQKKESQTKVTKVEGGGLSAGIDIAILDDVEKLILEVLNDYIKQTIDFKTGQQQKNPAKGGGPSLLDFEWRMMIAGELPECFQPYKDNLDVIENKLGDIISSTQKVKSFAALVKEKLRGIAKPKKADVEAKVCEAIVEDLPLIDIPTKRTYLTPVGTPITLSGKHSVNSICGSATAFPDGALLNFTINDKTYVAKFEKLGPPRFYGYYEFSKNQYGDVYTDPSEYKTGKTDIVFVQRTVEGGKATGRLYLGEYTITDNRTNQQIAANGGLPIRIDAIILPEQKQNTRSYNITFDCPVTPLDEYLATTNNRIQKWLSAKGLKADLYFSDCATGTATHITETNANAQTSADAKAEFDNGAFKNDVAIWACWDGKKWDIKHKYKGGALIPSNGKIKAELAGIQKEIDNRVDKLIKKAGTGNPTASAEIKYSYGEDGELYRESMDLFQLVVTVKDFGKQLVNYAKVPEPTWNNQDKAAEYTNYPVHVPPMLAGSGDQVLNELTGAIQFVNFGLDMVTEPELAKQTWQQLAGLTPETVKNLIVDAAESKADIYAKGGVIARHEAGADVVTVVVAASAAYKLLKDGHELVTKSGKKIKELANELSTFTSKSLSEKLSDLSSAWKSVYPEVFVERKFFEDVMGHYRYGKSSGWGHTADIADNFKAVDFYSEFTEAGNKIYAKNAVSMKTTTTKNVDTWLETKAVKDNIASLKQGLGSSNGITWNGKTIFYSKAEVHIYMPKENVTSSLKEEWLKKLSTEVPNIKFEINALEDFVK